MGLKKQYVENDTWYIELEGRIDTTNAADVKEELSKEVTASKAVIDCSDLLYLSSAGLRILLYIRKKYPHTEVINVSEDVYDILEMTGFTEMLRVSKKFKNISVEGCPVIGRGSNGIVYRIDPETIVKVYHNKDALEEIKHERDAARKALILGIPTALSYDIVKVGDHYGSVFELLNATSLAKMLIKDPSSMDECIERFSSLLKTIHAIEQPIGTFPDSKQIYLDWLCYLEDYLPLETYTKLKRMADEIPEDGHLMHGDYHPSNVMVQNGETLLIDMDTLSQGNRIFEFGSMYLALKGFYTRKDSNSNMLGITSGQAYELFRRTVSAYLETDDEEQINALEDKAAVIAYTRLMRRTIKREGFAEQETAAFIDFCKETLSVLAERLDSLV